MSCVSSDGDQVTTCRLLMLVLATPSNVETSNIKLKTSNVKLKASNGKLKTSNCKLKTTKTRFLNTSFSNTSPLESTLDAKVCKPFWNESALEWSRKLWSYIASDLRDLDATSFDLSLKRLPQNSWVHCKDEGGDEHDLLAVTTVIVASQNGHHFVELKKMWSLNPTARYDARFKFRSKKDKQASVEVRWWDMNRKSGAFAFVSLDKLKAAEKLPHKVDAAVRFVHDKLGRYFLGLPLEVAKMDENQVHSNHTVSLDSRVVECDEPYTSKTRGCCGEINTKLGDAKTFKCGYVADRDINGARNILLRYLSLYCEGEPVFI